jgi:hypothetical protein
MKPADAIDALLRVDLTESAIGDLVGASQSTINRVRHGRVRPNYELGKALVDLARERGVLLLVSDFNKASEPEARNG